MVRLGAAAAMPACLPPVAVRVSLAEVGLLLRALLPLPVWDVAAALAWLAYQQRRKAAAYRSHRARKLLELMARGP